MTPAEIMRRLDTEAEKHTAETMAKLAATTATMTTEHRLVFENAIKSSFLSGGISVALLVHDVLDRRAAS